MSNRVMANVSVKVKCRKRNVKIRNVKRHILTVELETNGLRQMSTS